MRADTPPALVEGVRIDDYKRSLDPFVALATAASVTSTLRLGTGVVLAAQHDPIVLAKQVATLDHLSGGRVELGIGFGWNRAEAADHGVAFADRRAIAREHVLCMQALWRDDPAEFHGEFVDLDPCWRRPSPCREPGSRSCSAERPPRPTSPPSPSTGTGGCPSAAPASARPSPSSAGLRGRPDVTRRTLRVLPFGTVPTEAKLEHFAASGSTRSSCGCRLGPRPRSWRSSTPMPPSSTASEAT